MVNSLMSNNSDFRFVGRNGLKNETELLEMSDSLLDKLEQMSDEEFDSLEKFPDFNY